MAIARTEIASKLLKSVGYDPATKVLEVEFLPKKGAKAGAVYRYADVPPEEFAKFSAAESRGSYFLKNISKNQFKYTRVEESHEAEAQTEPHDETLR